MVTLWPFILCLCVVDGASANPLDSKTLGENTEECELREESLFCDFQDSSTAVVSLVPLDNKIKKVFIHNAKKLNIAGPNCANIGLYNIHQVTISKHVENKVCESETEFAAMKSILTSVPDQVTNMFLEKCNVTNLIIKNSLKKLEVIDSVIDVMEISAPLKNSAIVLFEKSLINYLRKLILDYGAELTLKNTTVESVESKGLLLNHGTVIVMESSIINIANDSIVILPAITKTFEKYSGNIQVSGATSPESNFFVGFIVCIILLAVLLLVAAFFIIYRNSSLKELITKHGKKTNDQSTNKPENACFLTKESNTNDEADDARNTSPGISDSAERDFSSGRKSQENLLAENTEKSSRNEKEKESDKKKNDISEITSKGMVKKKADIFNKDQLGKQSKFPTSNSNAGSSVRDRHKQYESKIKDSVTGSKGKEMLAKFNPKEGGGGNLVKESTTMSKTTELEHGNVDQSQGGSECQPLVSPGHVKNLAETYKDNCTKKTLNVEICSNVKTKQDNRLSKSNDGPNTNFGKDWAGKAGGFDDIYKGKVNNDPEIIKTNANDATEENKKAEFDDMQQTEVTAAYKNKSLTSQKKTASFNFNGQIGQNVSRYDDIYTKTCHDGKEPDDLQNDDAVDEEFEALFANS